MQITTTNRKAQQPDKWRIKLIENSKTNQAIRKHNHKSEKQHSVVLWEKGGGCLLTRTVANWMHFALGNTKCFQTAFTCSHT